MPKSYIQERKLKLLLSQYKKVREKSGGQTTGAIYRALNEMGAINKKDNYEYLIKKPSSKTVINNFVASCIYKKILGFQSSEDEIVIDNDLSLMIKSKMFPKYEDVSLEDLKGTANGFEKVIAAKTFLCDTDIKNIHNLGLIPSKDGKYFVGIDHERVALSFLNKQLGNYQLNFQVFEKTKSFSTIYYARACEDIGSTSLQHIDYHIQYIVDYLSFVLEQLPQEVACKLVTNSLYDLCDELAPMKELFEHLEKNESNRSMNKKDMTMLKTCLSNSLNLTSFLETLQKANTEFTMNHKDILLKLYQAALELGIRKGLAQMKEVADLIRLDVAMRTNDLAEFKKILNKNPDLLVNSKRNQMQDYSNKKILFHVFETLVTLDNDKKPSFVDVLYKELGRKPDFIESVTIWNHFHNNKYQILISDQGDNSANSKPEVKKSL